MLSNLFQKASNLSESFQAVQDRLPESLQSLQNAKAGASKVQDEVMVRIGTKRQIKTKEGVREVVELCLLGGSQNVTKVRCLASDKEFALKRMCLGNPQKDDNEKTAPAERAQAMVSLEALQSLADKAEMLPSMGVHPNIAKCYSSQVDNTSRSHGHVFLMELCDESAASILQSKGSMTAEEVLQMVKDVVSGLEFLHGQKDGPVIHGSVEASHVMKGTGGEWKLASFGATTFDGESPGSAKVKSDVWQLGVLIFMSLFGTHPFGGEGQDSEAAMSLKKGCALAIPPSRPRTLLEGRLCILMHWLLAPDAALRPTSKQVGVMLGHLEKMVASQLLKTVPPPVRKIICHSLMGAERHTLVEGLQSINMGALDQLVKEFGDSILLNPKIIPGERLQDLLPRAVMSRIKELHTLYGIPEGSYDNVKVVASKNSKVSKAALKGQDAAQDESDENKPAAADQNQAPVDLMEQPQDLLDMGPKNEESKEKAEFKEPQDLLDMNDGDEMKQSQQTQPPPAQDLLDMDDCTEKELQNSEPRGAKEEAKTGLDLLDFGDEKEVATKEKVLNPCADAQQDMPGDLLDMGSQLQTQPQQSASLDLFDMGSAQEGQSQPQQPASLDLFDMGPESQPQQPASSDLFDIGLVSDTAVSTGERQEVANCAQQSTLPDNLLFDPFDSTTAAMPPTMAPMPHMEPSMTPVMASTMMPNNGYVAQSTTPAMVPMMPSTVPAVTGAVPVVGNPFESDACGAPTAPQANPFEASNDDAFAFAVSNLKANM